MTAGPATILLVEDNAEMRAFLQKELSDPHRVTVASNGTEAWNQIQENPPDLLLCDAEMPNMDGRALGRRVKEEEDVPRIPVFLLTESLGKAEEEASEENDEWADEVLEKPFGVAEARNHIDRYLPSRELPDLQRTGGEFLKEVVWTVERRLHDPEFKVQDLADEMDLSRRHLTRRLKEEAGMTPATLLRSRRIERAKSQLEEDPDTIGEVSETVGFHSPSHFSQAFRSEVGCSPTAYREKHGR